MGQDAWEPCEVLRAFLRFSQIEKPLGNPYASNYVDEHQVWGVPAELAGHWPVIGWTVVVLHAILVFLTRCVFVTYRAFLKKYTARRSHRSSCRVRFQDGGTCTS